MNVHKNARLTPQGRLLLVRRVTQEGWTVVTAAGAAGLSQRQSYRWLARYRAGGEAGLADRSSAPSKTFAGRAAQPDPNPPLQCAKSCAPVAALSCAGQAGVSGG